MKIKEYSNLISQKVKTSRTSGIKTKGFQNAGGLEQFSKVTLLVSATGGFTVKGYTNSDSFLLIFIFLFSKMHDSVTLKCPTFFQN